MTFVCAYGHKNCWDHPLPPRRSFGGARAALVAFTPLGLALGLVLLSLFPAHAQPYDPDQAKVQLAARTVSAVDAADVNATGKRWSFAAAICTAVMGTTGTPDAVDARAAIQSSVDGTTWNEVVRFQDMTTVAGNQRFASVSAVASTASYATPNATDLTGAVAAATTVRPGYFASHVRAVTQVKTITNGTAPTVTVTVTCQGVKE